MSSAKKDVATMLDSLPPDATYEDIQYHLYVLEKVKRGTDRAAAEGEIAHDEARFRLGKWLNA